MEKTIEINGLTYISEISEDGAAKCAGCAAMAGQRGYQVRLCEKLPCEMWRFTDRKHRIYKLKK